MKEQLLIAKIKRGDEIAFRNLYDLYFHKVLNYSYKILHSWEDAKEVTQDVFVKLWDKRAELNAEKSVSGFIFRITRFTSIDKLRKLNKQVDTLSISSAHNMVDRSMENELLDRELSSVYESIINKLPPKRKLIFQLSRDENLTYKEISEQLHISIKTVEAQIRLALQQIREDLKKYSSTLSMLLLILLIH